MAEKQKKTHKRIKLVLAFIVLFIIVTLINLRGTYLQYLSIGENYANIFWTNFKYTYITMAVNFIIIFISIIISTRIIKKGLKKFFDEENKAIPKLPNKSIAFIVAMIISIFTSSYIADKVILCFSNAYFGIMDPIFNNDIAFYVFQKPFIMLICFYFILLLAGLAIYSIIYYIIVFNSSFDGINVETLKKNTLIKFIITNVILISVIIGVLCFLNSQNILFEKFINLRDTQNTYLNGAGFTSVTIKLWAYRILSFIIPISVFIAINAFKKKQTKKGILTLSIVPVYLVCMLILVAIVGLIFVNPNQLDREKKYIAYNINNTREAYNIKIDEVEVQDAGTITKEDIDKNQDVLENIAIINSDTTLKTLMQYQTEKGYYTYLNASIGEYNGNLTYITPREILTGANRTYSNKTYEYTHGFGVIATSATKTNEKGQIEYISKDFESNELKINNPRIYFGCATDENIIVNAKDVSEFDYPKSDSTNAEYKYAGKAGLNLNFIDRLVLSIKTKDIKLAFNSGITKDSKVITDRNIIDRAKIIAPFLTYDSKPYLVISDEGNLVWVLDAYTTTNEYPYSQETIAGTVGERTRINYIRNSVKVLVDAYDGTTTFNITDRTDPIIMAYRNMYPDIFVDLDEKIPESISKHFIYPEYLYNIQANMLTRYHNVATEVMYRNDDVWAFATHNNTKNSATIGNELVPYYTMVNTVDQDEAKLGLVIPYTIKNKQNLTAYLVGNYDNNSNNKLTMYKLSNDSSAVGPMQLDNQIEQDELISKEIAALNVTGTRIIKNMLIIPIKNTLLYVEPIYQVAINESNVPILKKVVVASGNKVAIGDNLEMALEKLLSQYATNIEIENTDDKDGLIISIIKANDNLKTSNNSNDWEMIGKDMKKLQGLIDALDNIIKQEEEKAKNEVTNTATNDIINSGNVLNSVVQ